MLCALLLCKHLLLLRDDLGLVLEAQRERQADEERAGGHDPDEVPDELAARLEEARGLGHTRGDFVAGRRWDDVDERGEPFVEGLFAVRF